jgi:hypothetical protein
VVDDNVQQVDAIAWSEWLQGSFRNTGLGRCAFTRRLQQGC